MQTILELFLAALIAFALLLLTARCSHLTAEQQYYQRLWRAHCYYPPTGDAAQDNYHKQNCAASYRIGAHND